MSAENKNHPNIDLREMQEEEVIDHIRKSVTSLFPSDTLAKLITLVGFGSQREPEITNNSYSQLWLGGCSFFNKAPINQRFGSFAEFNQSLSHKEIAIAQFQDSVVIQLGLNKNSMLKILGEILISPNIGNATKGLILNDIVELAESKNNDAFVYCELESNAKGEINELSHQFAELKK